VPVNFLKRVDEYRLNAREARLDAQRVKNPTAKEGFAKLADEWDALAERLLKYHSSNGVS
jgi:hypothetical protein